MDLKQLPKSALLLLSLCFILLGGALIVWLISNVPAENAANGQGLETEQRIVASAPQQSVQASAAMTTTTASGSTSGNTRGETGATAETTATAAPPPITVGLAAGVPMQLLTTTLSLSNTTVLTNYGSSSGNNAHPVALTFDFDPQKSAGSYRYTFAAATRFDTIDTAYSWTALQQLWQQGPSMPEEEATATQSATASADTAASRFSRVAVLTETLPALTTILDEPGTNVVGYGTISEVIEASWRVTPTLALVPFDLLEPRLAVLAIDGQKPIENANKFDEATYPLVSTVYGHLLATSAETKAAGKALLAALPPGNRDASHLTVIAMTGVTAMVRLTADEMDKRGNGWPAEVVGPELASADITAISNEVPFVPGCETDTRMDNLTFCSKPEYMQALTDAGVDIIGLTGNHQNDYGREDAVISLDIYDAAGLPVYGGGRNKEEAFAPLYLEHNGNRLAFLGANSYGPTFAWATDDQPGSAEFDLNIMSATIRNIKQLGRANVVLAELQYQESYDVVPLVDQRQNFNALNRAGADIVTGVQSHVPQAMEFTDGKLILYGLGNLYFDQMWSQSTREGMIVKHTIYNNRHISTQIFPTLLYDYGQPRWTTAEEGKAILDRVFGASFW